MNYSSSLILVLYTQNLEIFAPIFDIPSWTCFWDLVDPKYNNRGLGYELFFYPRCVEQAKLRLGVIQNMCVWLWHNYFTIHCCNVCMLSCIGPQRK
jgi:hypothetical protein